MILPLEKYNSVIFDLGQVLVKYDWEHCLDAFDYSPEVRNAVAKAIFQSPVWEAGDLGTYGKNDWCDAFIKNAPEYEAEIRNVYKDLGKTILPTDYTEELIDFFKRKGYALYYLSNYSEGLFEKSKQTLHFLKDFDGGVFSWKEKIMKPNPAIYQCLLHRYKINPNQALYFDDIPENVHAACQEGIHGMVFTPSLALEILQK